MKEDTKGIKFWRERALRYRKYLVGLILDNGGKLKLTMRTYEHLNENGHEDYELTTLPPIHGNEEVIFGVTKKLIQ